MWKLLKYEFRRARTSLLTVLGVIAVLEMYFLISLGVDHMEHVVIAAVLMMFATYGAAVYIFVRGVASYASELKAKSAYLIFMTPNSGLKIMGSKYLYTFVNGILLGGVCGALGALDLSLIMMHEDDWQSFLRMMDIFLRVNQGVQTGQIVLAIVFYLVLVVLSLVIAGYSVTRPGALAGVKYFLVPNPKNFSWMTVVTAMGQMFYSLSIAMGILVTFGSYMKKDVSIEGSTKNVEIFDTLIAMMAGLMIIPAVFSFSGGDPDTLQAGPALMFITIPKVFASMGLGTAVGVLFFVLVLFAAITSSIALTESAVSTFEDELGWDRTRSTVLIGAIMVALGSLSALGYGPLAGVTVFGMQFLDFFDFLTNSVMMPIAAIATCLLVSRVIGVEKIEVEVTTDGKPFRRKKIFNFMIRYLCPVFAAIILVSSVANALGWISM